MDERLDLAEALFERLHADGVPHCVLAGGDLGSAGELDIAVPDSALAAVPRSLARFCRQFDLQLVQLRRHERSAWQAVFAWSDDVGRPRFLTAEIFGDWYRGSRLLLRSRELLAGTPEIRFIHLLLKAVFGSRLSDAEGRRLSRLWADEPRRAMEQIVRFWKRPSDLRLVAQAAKHGAWSEAARNLGRLRDAMRRGAARPGSALARLARLALSKLEPADAVIAFVGPATSRREYVRQALIRELAPAFPAGLATIAHGPEESHGGVDLRVLLEAGAAAPGEADVVVDGALPLPAAVARVERAVLHWLECRVERRYPEALVGNNPLAARALQFACVNLPSLAGALKLVLNCDIDCRLRAPILTPHPYGIVIEHGVEIGNRVTIMQQVTLARTEEGAPVIEDNVRIGPGARVLGPVRVGRGATVCANAVVTRDVPSHCTVAGEDRIVGAKERPSVAAERREDHRTVVNS
jgi:serine O-acetyltransferase